jgi:hypothetical protein
MEKCDVLGVAELEAQDGMTDPGHPSGGEK